MWGNEPRLDPGTPDRREPTPQQVEGEAGNGEQGVDSVAVLPLEVIAVHPVVGLIWPTTCSIVALRFISRLMAVVRRPWLVIYPKPARGVVAPV